ncbi:hypothetical protein I317_04937 [Kwoniella heveanensis CBS 569]|nr:hypothetical protein I317_04937 [Kwoniella heveanensis CBS 569]
MVYVVYGTIESSHMRMILIAAAEMGLLNTPAFELRKLDWMILYGPDDQFDCKASPFKRFPWFEDTGNGVKLYESRAIIKYLAARTKSPLLPDLSEPAAMAKFDSACSIELGDFAPYTNRFLWEVFYGPMFARKPPTPDVVHMCQDALTNSLRGYERILRDQNYLAGDDLTLVDLFHIPAGYLATQLGAIPILQDSVPRFPIPGPADVPSRSEGSIPLPDQGKEGDGTWPLPHVKAWWDKLLQRESVKLVNKMFEDRMIEWAEAQKNDETKTNYDYTANKL